MNYQKQQLSRSPSDEKPDSQRTPRVGDGGRVFGMFDRAYCINLAERFDRRRNAERQFESIGLQEVHFIVGSRPPDEGVFRTQGTHGCALSHARIFRQAKEEGLESIVIFEDDVVFSEDFHARIIPILEDLKKVEWDLFYFFHPIKGAFDLKGDRGDVLASHPSGLLQTAGTVKTHAYAIHSRCLDVLIEKTDPSYLSEHLPVEIRAVDKAIANLDLRFFACRSDLAFQDPGLFSSIDTELLPPSF